MLYSITNQTKYDIYKFDGTFPIQSSPKFRSRRLRIAKVDLCSCRRLSSRSFFCLAALGWSKKNPKILLMQEILPQLAGSLSHLQGFIHPRWCRISSINSVNEMISDKQDFEVWETKFKVSSIHVQCFWDGCVNNNNNNKKKNLKSQGVTSLFFLFLFLFLFLDCLLYRKLALSFCQRCPISTKQGVLFFPLGCGFFLFLSVLPPLLGILTHRRAIGMTMHCLCSKKSRPWEPSSSFFFLSTLWSCVAIEIQGLHWKSMGQHVQTGQT